jgi:hypothetical protein
MKNGVYHATLRFHRIRKLVSFDELLIEKVFPFKNAKLVTTIKFKYCLNSINISGT